MRCADLTNSKAVHFVNLLNIDVRLLLDANLPRTISPSGSKSLCMPILAVNTCANLALQLSGTTSCRYSDESAASLLHPKHPGIVYLHRYIIARIGVVLARHSSSFFLVYLNQPVCYACNSQ
jgi:hypothetical protein